MKPGAQGAGADEGRQKKLRMPGSRESGPEDEEQDRVAWKGAAAVAVVVAGLVVWRSCSPGEQAAAPGAPGGSAAAAAAGEAPAEAPPRCAGAAPAFVIDA
ncbi:MAG TPA: hypothetical protein VLS89_14560, partial [Candidatus Nanopelagicales bacterium]|nr:hypothetical protein [Candidatus Nanopelagicales bacterium]